MAPDRPTLPDATLAAKGRPSDYRPMQDAPAAAPDHSQHPLRPLVLEAARAHREQLVRYADDGTAWLQFPEGQGLGLSRSIAIGPDRQFCAIHVTFQDLARLADGDASPRDERGQSLRQLYERERQHYAALAAATHASGGFEPDYGSYVFDHVAHHLYLIAPERWHRLALVASNAKLVGDPAGALSWFELRRHLEGAVIGFAGASVGGNLLEGWLREARPKAVKLADPDHVELTNFNRAERVSLRHLVGSRSRRRDPRDSRQSPRVSKAEYLAYEQQLVDPYLDVYVYADGLTSGNVQQFLLGDGQREPAIDILVEEMDDLERKVEVRKLARQHRIDVLMLSDFGNLTQVCWNPFKERPEAPLSQSGEDEALLAALAAIRAGDRSKTTEFAFHLCGDDFFGSGPFADMVRNPGERLLSGLPQSGATAMAAGAIGGKELALRVLGHPYPARYRITYDLAARYARQG